MGRSDPTTTIPELKGVTWNDKYFDNLTDDDNVIAVFDFDYQQIEDFETSVTTAVLLCPCIGIPSILCCVPCTYKQNIHWKTYAQHVAITHDGIRYITEKRQSACGFDFQDVGKTSKTVPFDKITDCDVTEPAGATCICIQNVLSVLNVDTASGSRGAEGVPGHELSLAGLTKPNEMKKLVWTMKRYQSQGGGGGVAKIDSTSTGIVNAPNIMGATMDRGDGNEETNAILLEIRDELKELNSHLREKA